MVIWWLMVIVSASHVSSKVLWRQKNTLYPPIFPFPPRCTSWRWAAASRLWRAAARAEPAAQKRLWRKHPGTTGGPRTNGGFILHELDLKNYHHPNQYIYNNINVYIYTIIYIYIYIHTYAPCWSFFSHSDQSMGLDHRHFRPAFPRWNTTQSMGF